MECRLQLRDTRRRQGGEVFGRDGVLDIDSSSDVDKCGAAVSHGVESAASARLVRPVIGSHTAWISTGHGGTLDDLESHSLCEDRVNGRRSSRGRLWRSTQRCKIDDEECLKRYEQVCSEVRKMVV